MRESPEAIERRIKRSGGKPVRFGAQLTYGHFEVADAVVFEERDGVRGARAKVTIATGVLHGCDIDSELIVDGREFEVRDQRRVDDGALTDIWLSGDA